MREQFPTNKRAGDPLTTGHINGLSRVGNRLARSGPGSNQAGLHTDSMVSTAPPPPFNQGTMIITSVEGGGLYKASPRFYDGTSWDTDSETEWDVDGSDLGVTYVVDDKVVCYFDEQRGAFIPICCT